MSATYIPNFKKIHQYLVPKSSKNFQKLRKQKFSITIFGIFLTTDKDENGVVELAVESLIEETSILIKKTTTLKFDLIWPDLDLRST